ncbi:PD-(D/E)XK nuclease family protein [Ktedonospora formicarum]|uniref:PD-(D/E)XK endonuclease-like domain-containing protein n=1 Tax=Ktedonospora formicarum TaxID=2778364 RepID=A0A8J3MS74_9CHLR|nr:PD-(D/E)XK nuclease family protein [Ktedonospora formicarum]GHO44561.1 hypothetical protein KSX_27240 [Ktedonospora formicarum]
MGRALGVECVRGQVSFDDCRECAAQPLHPCPWPSDLVAMMRGEGFNEPDEQTFSPSRILGCSRQRVLMQQHGYYIIMKNQYPMVRGHMFHALMEGAPPVPGWLGAIREVRMSIPIKTRYGTMQFRAKSDCIQVIDTRPGDEVTELDIRVLDYKSTSKIEHSKLKADREHQMQVNMYGLVAAQCIPLYLLADPEDEKLDLVTRRSVKKIHKYLPELVGKSVIVNVVGLEVGYAAMEKARRFVSEGELSDKGKMTKRSRPQEWEDIVLDAITLLPLHTTYSYVQAKIEELIAAEENLPKPFEPDEDDYWRCERCPVYDACHKEG